jgi:drug/metabolite transporter (DMT)-like permease
MKFSSMSARLVTAVISAVSFGTSGAFVKPLLEAGWSPAAAVTARALTAGVVLLPFVLVSLRARWAALWHARWRVLGMGVIAVAFTQLAYFAAIQRIPVSAALLIEFLAPLILVGFTWASTRRMPRPTILIGSVLAVGGLVLVIGPGALHAVDPIGLAIAFGASIGCAAYFVIAAHPSDGLPPVALAGSGLVLGGLVLALVAATGLLPFTATFDDLPLFGTTTPWWIPLLIVAVLGTALAYATGITASRTLGSRLASFIGLLEVVFASLFAWMMLGEELTPLQLVGGVLIIGGIAAVPAEHSTAKDVSGTVTGPAVAAVPEGDVAADQHNRAPRWRSTTAPAGRTSGGTSTATRPSPACSPGCAST